MDYLTLNLITGSRLVLCGPIWMWCWWRRPRGMVVTMALVATWFLVTDHLDGQWARAYGLVSELGYWLDHIGDFLFYGCVIWTTVRGSREPAVAWRPRRGPVAAPGDVVTPAGSAPTAAPEAPPASSPSPRPPPAP